jgi:hypothetical protein
MDDEPLVMISSCAWRRCTTDAAVQEIFFRGNFHEINRSQRTVREPQSFRWRENFFLLVSLAANKKAVCTNAVQCSLTPRRQVCKMISDGFVPHFFAVLDSRFPLE